jgi:DNA helicase HerA-like ATPase
LQSVAIVRSTSAYLQLEEIPRVVIWQLGRHVSQYVRPMLEAVELGDVAIVLDEAYEYAPSGARWTGPDVLRDIVLAGRHLARADGEIRPTHLVVATQYPRTVHHLIWSQAYTVMVGVVAGEQTASWLRDNFGDQALAAVRELKPYQWQAVAGVRPEMPGYGPNG